MELYLIPDSNVVCSKKLVGRPVTRINTAAAETVSLPIWNEKRVAARRVRQRICLHGAQSSGVVHILSTCRTPTRTPDRHPARYPSLSRVSTSPDLPMAGLDRTFDHFDHQAEDTVLPGLEYEDWNGVR